jgi:hypothetical protein
MKKPLFAFLFVVVLAVCSAPAQLPASQSQPCSNPSNFTPGQCAPNLVLTGGPPYFSATPLMDTTCSNGVCPDYGDGDHNKVTLYGVYGNNEKTSTNQAVLAHYNQGKTLANNIQPRCRDGSIPAGGACQIGDLSYPPAIVFLFIGFSNWDIRDWWRKRRHLAKHNSHLV